MGIGAGDQILTGSTGTFAGPVTINGGQLTFTLGGAISITFTDVPFRRCRSDIEYE